MGREHLSIGSFRMGIPHEKLDTSVFTPYAFLLEWERHMFDSMAPRFERMRLEHHACYQAVDVWKLLETQMPGFTTSTIMLGFSHPIQDTRGYTHTGQMMLSVHKADLPTTLVMDVAGYLFGFEFQDIFTGIGTEQGIGKLATDHYRKKGYAVDLRITR